MPVMADESAWNARDAFEIAERRAAEIVSIYTTKPGGLYRASRGGGGVPRGGHALQCQRFGGDRVGNRANVIFAAAMPVVTLSCVVPVSTPEQHSRPGRWPASITRMT